MIRTSTGRSISKRTMADRVLTGLHAIEEELRRGAAESRLLVSGKGPRIDSLIALARSVGAGVSRVSRGELTRVGGARARSAVLVVSANVEPAEFQAILPTLKRDDSLVVIADGITDPHNLGAVLRSADQFGVDLVVLPERRSAGLGDTVSRTSSGADRWVRTAIVPNLVRAIEALREHGYWIYGADAAGVPAHETKLSGRTALVLGREGEGLHRLVRESCDALVAIPTVGHIDSLNVSVSAGILMYEIRRQAGFSGFAPRA